ncbi:MAG: hypothetical protein WC635_00435 [Bacteriovorax sp.]|jgi:hypothetical protein
MFIKMKTFLTTIALLTCICLVPETQAYDKMNRLGIGMSNQLKNDFPALSFKLQKNRSFAFGGLMGLSTDKNDGGYGVGMKVYRNIFDEPQLNFYLAGMGALLNNKIAQSSYSGFQFDLSLGSEFHFSGLNSIGFSFEFGVSAHKTKDFVLQTLGNNFIVSAVHFYL